MLWMVFFAVTVGLCMVAAQEQSRFDANTADHSQLAREYSL